MAGAMGDEAWRGRLRRVRLNGIRGVNLKYTLIEVSRESRGGEAWWSPADLSGALVVVATL